MDVVRVEFGTYGLADFQRDMAMIPALPARAQERAAEAFLDPSRVGRDHADARHASGRILRSLALDLATESKSLAWRNDALWRVFEFRGVTLGR